MIKIVSCSVLCLIYLGIYLYLFLLSIAKIFGIYTSYHQKAAAKSAKRPENAEEVIRCSGLKVHKNENFLASILNFALFHC